MMKKIKKWAVCFSLSKKCMQGEVLTFDSKKEAKTYIKELHKKIGGFEGDHHIVPCIIHFNKKSK